MRLTKGRLLATALLGALLATNTAQAEARPTPDQEQVRVNSLSGAFLAARSAENDNNLDSAIAYYRRALAFDPGNQTLQQSLLLGLISKGEFDEALPYARDLSEVPEIERFSRLALAVDAFRKQDYADAEHWLKLTLESDLDRLITGLINAWAKLGSGDGEAALAFLDNLEGPEWYDLFVGYHRALIAEQAGQTDTARTAYEATTTNVSAGGAAPEAYLRALEAHAGFLARQGDKEAALAVLDEAEEFAPGRVTIQALREDIEAGDEVEPLVANPAEGAAEALLNLATALNRGGGESFVRLYLQYARALTPDSYPVLIQLAGVAEEQGDSEKAIEYYEQIPAGTPVSDVAELQIGLNLADLERHAEAIEHLRAVLERNPDDMRAHLALGGVYASQKNFADAAKIYDSAVATIDTPTRADWNIFYQRGIAYERLKEWEKAEPNFFKALELYPDHPQVLNYLGYSWVDMNINLKEGLEMIQKAVELRPSDGYIVDSLGWAYYRLGRYEDAVRELERAVSLMPADPVLNDHLGDAYWRVGRKLEATFQWSHTRDMDPEPPLLAEVQKKLADGLPPPKAPATANNPEDEEIAPNVVPLPEGAGEKQGAAEPVIETVSAGPASYTVLPGQSLWSIASDVLGDGSRYRELLELNPDLQGDPGRLVPGQELRLPAPAE